MRNPIARLIRSIIVPDETLSAHAWPKSMSREDRRLYRRAKAAYVRVPHMHKSLFLADLVFEVYAKQALNKKITAQVDRLSAPQPIIPPTS